MIKAGIIGATGYAGGELVRLLLGHKEVEIVWYGSRSYVDEKYAHVYRNMFEIVDATCLDDNLQELASQVEVIFTATPQGYLASILTEEILSQVVIDCSVEYTDGSSASMSVSPSVRIALNTQTAEDSGSDFENEYLEVTIQKQ